MKSGGVPGKSDYPSGVGTWPTCNCTCGCKREADGDGPYPTLCDVCGLATALNSSKCGVPYKPTAWPKLDPEVAITDAQKDKAIQAFVAENGF